jgi:hypothetical protein
MPSYDNWYSTNVDRLEMLPEVKEHDIMDDIDLFYIKPSLSEF